MIIRCRLNSSTFWVFEPVFTYDWSKSSFFMQKASIALSLDLIFHNNFWWNIKSFSKQNSKLRIHSKPDRNQSKLTMCTGARQCSRNFVILEIFLTITEQPCNVYKHAVLWWVKSLSERWKDKIRILGETKL